MLFLLVWAKGSSADLSGKQGSPAPVCPDGEGEKGGEATAQTRSLRRPCFPPRGRADSPTALNSEA